MSEKELKEGCGEEYDSNIKTSLGLKKIKICGASGFCPVCKAKLKILQERNAEVKEIISKLPFIMCLEDAKGDDEICKSWREQVVIRREELLQKLGLEE